jgi:cytoskeleton protein RodZ
MGSFGERLRREREMRGISLDNIAESTKIGTRLLRALEEEQFELLPGGIFNKGFVRAYAKYLGLNEDEAVVDYLIAAGESSLDPKVIAEQNDSRIDRSGRETGDSRAIGFPIIPVLILLIVIAAGLGGWHIYRDRVQHRQAKAEASAVPVNAPSQPVGAPAAAGEPEAASANTGPPAVNTNAATGSNNPSGTTATGATPAGLGAKTADNQAAATGNSPVSTNTPPMATKAGASPAESFEVTVRAKDHAWVSIKSDGKIAVRGIIAPPDVKTVRATDQIVFWTGNAGAVEISFNGQPVALEGGPNTAGTLVFNAHGAVNPKPAAVAREP